MVLQTAPATVQDGWTEVVHKETGLVYYWNKTTGKDCMEPLAFCTKGGKPLKKAPQRKSKECMLCFTFRRDHCTRRAEARSGW
jgi:hypothetical protein